jgi:hypothetical protein
MKIEKRRNLKKARRERKLAENIMAITAMLGVTASISKCGNISNGRKRGMQR